MGVQPYELAIPSAWSSSDRRRFISVAKKSGDVSARSNGHRTRARPDAADPSLDAAIHVLNDLVDQGWAVSVSAKRVVSVVPPQTESDPIIEKARVRGQELIKRDEQLATPSVMRFISELERPREFRGRFVSIFSLMRDGDELSASLRAMAARKPIEPEKLKAIIDPYVQVVLEGERCAHTGLSLGDIWRYFRHTWTNQYASTPGRTMKILVRDRAAEYHPVIGIAALGSAIVQISERERWIGWQSDTLVHQVSATPTLRFARWITTRLQQTLDELYLDDLIEDGLYWPSLWKCPTDEQIEQLMKEATRRRRQHHRFVRKADFKALSGGDGWQERARSDLFRSKRCLALAHLLRARLALAPFLFPKPTAKGLSSALKDVAARRAISGIIRRQKAESIGTEIADLTGCGAIAPYNSLLGGKLVSMLAVSPTVIRAYHSRYKNRASEIASSLAGRPIQRRSHLVFVGTTSLYGSGSSQYNRLRLPAAVLDGAADVQFHALGKSRSFGTSHLSQDTMAALTRLAQQSRSGIRINSIFGEGVNPKLRKVRDALDLLGWPSDQLLQHRRPRIVYGVSLVTNLLPYLLGLDQKPKYIFRHTIRDDVTRITLWWLKRWLLQRIESEQILEAVASHTLVRPVCHGARVLLPITE